MILAGGTTPLLPPIEEAGSGQVRERQTAFMAEIIEKLNDLFHGGLTDQETLIVTVKAGAPEAECRPASRSYDWPYEVFD